MKRGEITFTTIVKTILAIGVVLLLLSFSVRLFSPMFKRGDETAKSYMKILKEQIEVADDGDMGEFFMWWVDGREGEKSFYLVYFGDAIEAEIEKNQTNPSYTGNPSESLYIKTNASFNSFGNKPNKICICYSERDGSNVPGMPYEYDTSCDYCEGLSYPAEFTGKDVVEGTWIEESGDRLSIKLNEEEKKYVFAEIK